MDGRRWVAALLLSSLAGCSTLSGSQSTSLTNPPKANPVMPEAGQATVARAMSTADPKNKEPIKASTFVAVASYREQLAANPELTFAEAEQVRSQIRQAYNDALKADPRCTAAYIGLAKSYVTAEDAPQAFAM